MPCVCQTERRVQAALPPHFWRAQLTHFAADVQAFCWEWLADPQRGLLVSGKVGRGKTHLAAALVRIRREQNKRALFCDCAKLYEDLRECYVSNVPERDVLRPLLEEPFLVLDDVAAGSLSDFQRTVLLRVLNARGNERKATVVTSNLTAAEIGRRMDDRIGSRLAAMVQLEMEGRDRRVKT